MAKPKEESDSSENMYSRWLCNFSKQHRELLDGSPVSEKAVTPVSKFPPSCMALEISGNMKGISNFMKLPDPAGITPENFACVNSKQATPESLGSEELDASPCECIQTNDLPTLEQTQKQMQRSYTAPDKTGIDILQPVVWKLL
ncbi:hypothetical protein E2320_009778 [Naja naja]|nr:hypothetical protein E2320_009778 [Naja naja]